MPIRIHARLSFAIGTCALAIVAWRVVAPPVPGASPTTSGRYAARLPAKLEGSPTSSSGELLPSNPWPESMITSAGAFERSKRLLTDPLSAPNPAPRAGIEALESFEEREAMKDPQAESHLPSLPRLPKQRIN